MNKSLPIIAAVATWAFVATTTGALAKEMTISGEAKCAKCMLKETQACQTVIQVQENGKPVNYYLADNDIAKTFHENVCHEAKKVTATGEVKMVDGKNQLTLSKIELAK
jgi:capsid protein